jgi:hypothetical protein
MTRPPWPPGTPTGVRPLARPTPVTDGAAGAFRHTGPRPWRRDPRNQSRENSKIEQWHKRHALSLASQLPDSTTDALIILRFTQTLVEDFMVGQDAPAKPQIAVVTELPAGRRRTATDKVVERPDDTGNETLAIKD